MALLVLVSSPCLSSCGKAPAGGAFYAWDAVVSNMANRIYSVGLNDWAAS